jgi:hypothetical protein
MPYRTSTLVLTAALVATGAVPVAAQRVPFVRTFDAAPGATLDVSTIRGRIDVLVGEPGRVTVTGEVIVRSGFTVPANALELAQRVAADPPVREDAGIIRLQPPAGDLERRAMTISYRVTVPRGMSVRTVSNSGATTIDGVGGRVSVETQSGAIELRDLGGPVDVTGSSGSVAVDGVAGDLRVSTQSGSIKLRRLASGLHVRTQSGSVVATVIGRGDVTVETSSSGIDVSGVHGGLSAVTESGRIRLSGLPLAPWQVASGSGSLDLAFEQGAAVTLEASSRSGSVRLDDVSLSGSTAKGEASGTIGGGGPVVHASSRSGSIRITETARRRVPLGERP